MSRTAHLPRWLPRGRTLPGEVWASRHRGLLLMLAAHLLLLPTFAVTQGWSVHAAWLFDVVPAALGAGAGWARLSRVARSSLCALALLSCSAMLVVAWHGAIEAHFHYFVMVGALALYEEWWAYLLAIGFVVLQHGLMGAVTTHAVFDHPPQHAWRWAAIHGAFVGGLAVTNLISWRANEVVRGETESSEERFRRAFDDAPVAIALVSPRGRLLQANHELRRRTGHDQPEGLWFWDLVPAADRHALAASWPPAHGHPEGERRYVRADGSTGWILWRHSLIRGEDGAADHYVSQGVDMSAHKLDQQRLDHQAHHDPLTGLPNRARFDRLLAEALERRQAVGGTVVVLFADIDNFKVINDSLGHRSGDELLVAMAERLGAELRPDDTLARFGAAWRAAGRREFVISVNLSPRQLSSPNLAAAVARALSDSGLPAWTLCLEITESAIMEDPEAARRILQGLRALGVKLAIDDFGVGYSSLSHLKYLLPVDLIKIDRSFVDGLLGNRDCRAIVTAIVELAAALGVQSVGEGVETAEQSDALRELGCHVAQGYHYFRPQLAADLDREFARRDAAITA